MNNIQEKKQPTNEEIASLEQYLMHVGQSLDVPYVTKETLLRKHIQEKKRITPSPYAHFMRYTSFAVLGVAFVFVIFIGYNRTHLPKDNLVISSTNTQTNHIAPETTPHDSFTLVDTLVDDLVKDSVSESNDAQLAFNDYQSIYSSSSTLDDTLTFTYAN